MKPQPVQVNIYDISYPCYVAAIPNGAQRIINIPGQSEYKYLEGVKSYVIEAYKTPSRIYVFDVVPFNLWTKKVCKIPYEKRLKFLRQLCTSQITNFDKVMDLDSTLVDNPYELSDYCEALLTAGFETVRIMDVNGNYVFGECTNGEYMELKL